MMLRIVSTLITSFILGLLVTSQTGCLLAVAAAGTGTTVAYVRGDLETTLDAEPRTVVDAADRALKNMEMAVVSKNASALDATSDRTMTAAITVTVISNIQRWNICVRDRGSVGIGTFASRSACCSNRGLAPCG